MDLKELEKALDAGHVEIAMINGRWWKARRNGKTRRWVRDPMRFEIPIKFGLKKCATLDQTWLSKEGIYFRVNKD
jgi:hypothetical protein